MSLLRIEETDEDVNSVHHPVEDESLESFFETEFGLNVLQAIDPIEDNDSTNLATSTQHPPLGRTLTTFSKFSLVSAFSTFSNGSVLSFRSTGAIYPLEDLCDRVIDKHMWLQMARIVSTSCYSQYRNFVLHRFLIFRLYRPEKKDIWLRIDRKAGSTILSLVRKGGKTRANDTAQLSASEKDLIGKARRENQQIFDKPPFLGDFSDYLRVICDELREYKVWPDNCWMFCSLLQEHLGISGDGHYAFGGPVVPNTAPLVRTRISERAVVHVTPYTIMTALQSAAWTLIPRWQPLGLAKPIGWLSHSIAMFLAKIAHPAQGLGTSHHSQGVMEWITNSLVVTRLEKNDLHSRIAAHCIETFCRLPEDNVLQLPNPLILNSGIPDLPSQIHSKISSDVQYAALYGFLHVVEIENPSTELFSKLETFFAGSAIKWLEVLSLLGATKNALVELDKVTVWYKSQSRQLQDHNLKESLLRLLMQCRRFTYQFHGVISVSAGHITHSALSHSPDADWRMRYCGRSTEHLPTVRGRASAWDSLLTIRGHTGWVCWVSFLPDGSRVVSGSWDGTARIWDAVTGDELMIFRGHTQRVCTVSFPSDGSRLASASEDQTVRIWDALTGDELKVLRGHTEQVWSVSFSPDGSKVASSSQDSTVRIWDAVAGNELKVLRGHTMSIGSVSFSSDGSRLASGSDDRTVRIWNAVTGNELMTLQGHTGIIRSVSFSPDGSRLASGCDDMTVRIWDAVTGDNLKVLRGHTRLVFSVSFSSDGSRVATGSFDMTVRIWDAVTGDKLKVFRGHTHFVRMASFSSDGFRLASSSDDMTVRIWDAMTRDELRVLQGHAGSVWSVSFSSDGSWLASGSNDKTVRIWDAITGNELKVLRGHTESVSSVSFSPDGSRLASASDDEIVRIWDAATGDALKVLQGHTGSVSLVSFSSDGSNLALESSDKVVQIWDVVTGEETYINGKSISYPDSFSNPSTIPCDCSFAEVNHDELNHIHLFIGACGTPHFIAPSCISDIVTTWKISHNRQAIAVGLGDGGLFVIQAPQMYRCVEHATS